MPPRDERVEKPEQPESSRGDGYKDGLARDSTVASKQQLAYFCISDILSKSSLGWHCYEAEPTPSLPPFHRSKGIKELVLEHLMKAILV